MAQPEILLVDDERAILDLAAVVLREAGFTVMTAISADIALIFLEQGLRFRILITDVVLPGMLDGFALAHKAREIIPSIQVIYATGFAGVARVRAVGSPYGTVLMKPWHGTQLVELVHSLLRHHANV